MDDAVEYEPQVEPPLTWEAIPPTDWARDHWSTLLYLETRAVGYNGKINNANMRCDRDLHPLFAHHDSGRKYPTRLLSRELDGHDDWSCMEDMIAAGMLCAMMHGATVWVTLTPCGEAVAGALRAYRARGNDVAGFSLWYYSMYEEESDKDDE